MFQLTPELLEMGLQRLGIAAGQLKSLDADCKKALLRFVMSAVQSGNANAFIKERLSWLESYEPPEPEPRVVKAEARVVDAPTSSWKGGRKR